MLLAKDLALHNLDVLQAGEHLVLDLEGDLHAERGAFLDGERFLCKSLNRGSILQIDNDIVAAVDLEAQGEDDAFAGVVRVGDVLACSEAK